MHSVIPLKNNALYFFEKNVRSFEYKNSKKKKNKKKMPRELVTIQIGQVIMNCTKETFLIVLLVWESNWGPFLGPCTKGARTLFEKWKI